MPTFGFPEIDNIIGPYNLSSVTLCIRSQCLLKFNGGGWLAVWCSGNIICHITEAILCWARFVLGWETIFGRVYHLSLCTRSTQPCIPLGLLNRDSKSGNVTCQMAGNTVIPYGDECSNSSDAGCKLLYSIHFSIWLDLTDVILKLSVCQWRFYVGARGAQAPQIFSWLFRPNFPHVNRASIAPRMHQNVPYSTQKSKNFLGRGCAPSPVPFPVERGHPLRRQNSRAFGESPLPSSWRVAEVRPVERGEGKVTIRPW